MLLKIYLLDYREVPLTSLLDSRYISPLEKVSLSKYKLEGVKLEKTASSYMKNKYIGRYYLGEFGKPLSDKCYFNVSHSHGVVVLVKDDVPIGIDIELVKPVEDSLKKFASSKDELDYIRDDTSFYEVWTNKEALVKADGRGIKSRPNVIPGLPINGLINYQDKTYMNKTIKYQNYVISVSRLGIEDYTLDIELEVI